MARPTIQAAAASDLLFQDSEITLRRSVDPVTRNPVLIASPVSDHPSPAILGRLSHEYTLRAGLDRAWAALPIALSGERRKPQLVLADPGGLPLEAMLGRPMPVPHFLDCAILIASAVRQMHESGVIHKDIKPGNILVDGQAARAHLTGFGHASGNLREHQTPAGIDVIAGTFAYMAPEQTGRMNRSVDSRSDLYSLGVVFYRMLTGALPFVASEPLEWIYCHIARQAETPSARVDTIPMHLSVIVMKLLAKNAEERYQTAAGLEADLLRCRDMWQRDRRIDPFALADDDISTRLLIPEQLYGRERESAVLAAAFERVVQSGDPEVVMVSGYSGIGKSVLVHELMKEIVARRALFVSGKYDQYKRDIPFATLAQAFGNMIRQVLTESETQIADWRSAILDAVGRNGQVLIDLIPELEWVIGPQPAVIGLGTTEARNRFQSVFRKFIGVCATAEHPLLLFLDDMQWIDPASLGLLEHLATQRDVRHVLTIGAYRENEVNATHPLVLALENLRKSRTVLHEIVLKPLATDDVLHLMADAIRCDARKARPLAKLIYQKTGGNPFFAIQFLMSLAEERLLGFDPATRTWTWDPEAIGGLGYSDNVVDLMVAKLQRLQAGTLETLKQLACLGHSANIATLSLICKTGKQEIAAALSDAVRAGFVSQSGENYRFVHDRIQEASYSLIAQTSLPALHLGIARVLSSGLAREEADERLFEIVDHFNRGAALIADAAERSAVRDLNIAAAKKAKAAIAYAAARTYLAQAMVLLPDDAWRSANKPTFDLCLMLAECEFLTGSLEQADGLFDLVVSKADSDLDRAEALRLRMHCYQSVGRFTDALNVALSAMRLLGMSFPDSDADIQTAFQQEQQAFIAGLGQRAISELADLPVASDPTACALMSLLGDAGAIAFNARPVLTPLVYCKALNMALKYGNAEATCMTYISYGSFSVALGDIPGAFAFAELGLQLNERFSDLKRRGTLLYVQGAHINLWKRPLASSIPILERGFLACQEVGNLVFAAYNAAMLGATILESGEQLGELVRVARRYAGFCQENRNEIIYQWLRLHERLAENLRGNTPSPHSFDDDNFSEQQSLAVITSGNHTGGITNFHQLKQIAAVMHGRFREALAAGNAAAVTLKAMRSTPVEAAHHFYHAVTIAALYADAAPGQQAEFRDTLLQKQKTLAYWVEHYPENYRNRLALVSAEIARIEGRDLDAMRLYDEAVRLAAEDGFVQNEGLANERAADFYRARGFETGALAYLRNARACYRRWGAEAVVARIDRDNPALQPEAPASIAAGVATKVEHLDLMTVLKASQAVSDNIVLDSLIEKLLTISVEHAGADRGLLILVDKNEHRIAAEAVTNGKGVGVSMTQSATAWADQLCEPALKYVIRTNEKVLIDDAHAAHPFAADAYLAQKKPRSVLCLPLLRQASLVGILYLENHLTPGAFSKDRTAVLELLASQAAISLENATLYANLQREQASIRELNASLEQRVAEKTRDLEAARDNADRANRSKSEFLANMSHEIRTPINAITGFTTLALRTELDPKQTDYLEKIHSATQALLRIISDLLDFSKIEAGHLDMETIPFHLSEVMDTTVNYVGALAERKGLALLINVDPEVPLQLLGDPLRLGQILANLCGNAVKFTERGEIEVRVALQSRVQDQTRLLFSVRDTGIGLTPEQAGKLFQAFTQADASTTRKFGGTGLGLVICQRLVGLMNGRIWLESQEGLGTTIFFEIELGLGDQGAAVTHLPPPAVEQLQRLSGVRVLLVEDNPINQQLASELLEQEGATVRVAGNGRLALDVLWETGIEFFDVALMDLQMPEMDGYRATIDIRRIPGNERLPVIAMTAHAMLEERERCLAAGMQDHISKPIDAEILITRIVQWVGPANLARAARRIGPAATAQTVDGLPQSIAGVDLQGALKRCGNDAKLLRKLFGQFHTYYAGAAAEVEQLCAAGKLDAAHAQVHTIRGAAANLGMIELAASAETLERMLHELINDKETGHAGRLAGARLLLVEDNPINQQLAQELLEQEGAQVQVAGNGRVALEAIQARGMDYFDAALVDLQMPEVDGYETATRLRKLPGGERMPLIAMTGHAMAEERAKCLAVGMQDHLAKPIDPELMVEKLVKWIGADAMLQARGRAAPASEAKHSPRDAAAHRDLDTLLSRFGVALAAVNDSLAAFREPKK